MKAVGNIKDQFRGVNFESLSHTIFVNTLTGDDGRTGETNTTNAITGCVKTLDRVIELHSSKALFLRIFVSGGMLEITKDYQLIIPKLEIRLEGVTTGLIFKKKTLLDSNGVNVGEGTYRLLCVSDEIIINNIAGKIEVEGHSGSTGDGIQSTYSLAQGALAITTNSMLTTFNHYGTVNVYNWQGNFIIGANTVFVVSGSRGAFEVGSKKHIYWRYNLTGGTFNIDSTARESLLLGDRLFPRSYQPLSSTDTNVSEGEMVLSPTTNKLYIKRAGVIRDAMGTTFA